MNFHPCNRHLLLRSARENTEKEEPTVLLPEDYEHPKEEFGSYVVIGAASDCSIDVRSGDVVLVENTMVKELLFEGETYVIILENYVFGCLDEDDSEEEEWNDAWER